jgi:hypothetical protein
MPLSMLMALTSLTSMSHLIEKINNDFDVANNEFGISWLLDAEGW